MIFKRSVQRYGRTPEPETPYQRAGQLWDERIGSARVQARNWRLMAFGALALSSGLSSALVWQSMQSRVVPYVVEVDRLGEARAITPAEAAYHPSDPQIAWALAHFIGDVRSVSLDPVLTRASWLEAYDFTTRRGAQFMSDYARSTNPFAAIGERTVSIQVTSVVRASERSFQLKWVETSYDRGVQTGVAHWTAIVTLVVKPPVTSDALRKNPLGLYVDAIDWSRELEVAQPQLAAPTAPAMPSAMPLAAPVSSAGDAVPVPNNQEVQP